MQIAPRLAVAFLWALFADAERRKDVAEQVVAANRAGDAAQCFVGKAQLFGDEFAVLCAAQLGEGVVVMRFCLLQRAQVAFAGDVRAFFAFVTSHPARDFVAQGVDARAGFCREPEAGRLRAGLRRRWCHRARCRRAAVG